jgi:hypothetical protein
MAGRSDLAATPAAAPITAASGVAATRGRIRTDGAQRRRQSFVRFFRRCGASAFFRRRTDFGVTSTSSSSPI